MSPPGRSQGEYHSAQHVGCLMSPPQCAARRCLMFRQPALVRR